MGVTRGWNSRWYSDKEGFAEKLLQDAKIRKIVTKELSTASLSRVDIERTAKQVRVIIHTGRPGMVIGRKGAQIEKVKEDVQAICGELTKIQIDIREVPNPNLDAQIVSDNLAFQLLKRVAFRRAMKKIVQAHKDAGGKGIKVKCSGRLGGAEIARAEGYKWGKIPLQTLSADIDYGFSEARTTYGIIGVKVWIYKGDKFDMNTTEEEKEEKKNRSR